MPFQINRHELHEFVTRDLKGAELQSDSGRVSSTTACLQPVLNTLSAAAAADPSLQELQGPLKHHLSPVTTTWTILMSWKASRKTNRMYHVYSFTGNTRNPYLDLPTESK